MLLQHNGVQFQSVAPCENCLLRRLSHPMHERVLVGYSDYGFPPRTGVAPQWVGGNPTVRLGTGGI